MTCNLQAAATLSGSMNDSIKPVYEGVMFRECWLLLCFSPALYFIFLVMGFFLFKRNKYRELYFYQMSRLIKEITNSIKTKPSVALSNIMSTDLHGMPP